METRVEIRVIHGFWHFSRGHRWCNLTCIWWYLNEAEFMWIFHLRYHHILVRLYEALSDSTFEISCLVYWTREIVLLKKCPSKGQKVQAGYIFVWGPRELKLKNRFRKFTWKKFLKHFLDNLLVKCQSGSHQLWNMQLHHPCIHEYRTWLHISLNSKDKMDDLTPV